MASYLITTHRFPGYLHRQGRWAPSLYSEQSGALLDRYLSRLSYQDHAFFLPRPVNDRFHAANVQCDPTIPSFALLASPISSPCLDANEAINLWATGSLGFLTLQLCQTNRMWEGEPSKLLVAKGYYKYVGAKLLQVVDETLCSIPTNDANCCHLDCPNL